MKKKRMNQKYLRRNTNLDKRKEKNWKTSKKKQLIRSPIQRVLETRSKSLANFAVLFSLNKLRNK